MYKTTSNDKRIQRRQAIEALIVRRIVRDALKAGYVIDVNDGGEELAVKGATTFHVAMDALINTDEDYLIMRRKGDKRGWVRLVYGNDGWDVICDYSAYPHIEAVLAGALALGERLEARAH